MIVEQKQIQSKLNKDKSINYVKAKCDFCGVIFERKYSKAARLIAQEFHFCSRKCCANASKKGGLIYKKRREISLEKHGVNHPTQLYEVQEKIRQTMIERHGVDHNVHLPGAHELLVTMAQSDEACEKRRLTHLEKYGAEHIFQTDKVKKRNGAWIKSRKFKLAAQKTCLKKFGVKNAMHNESVKKKSRQNFERAMISKYGVVHPVQIPGNYSKISKAEREFHTWLVQFFPQAKIETQVPIEKWTVDFRLNDHLYIHFDGVYWHGLDRSLKQIRESHTKIDAQIYKAYKKDRRQDEYFKENNIPFLRITDEDFKKDPCFVLERIQKFL